MVGEWHPKVSAAHAMWLQLRNDGTLPRRSDFDPALVPALLPNIWLIDVQGEPLRFRFRLIGTTIVGVVGRELGGRWLDEVVGEFESVAISKDFKSVVEEAKPRHYRGPPLGRFARDVATLERVTLPLAADGRTVNMLLGLTVFFDQKGQEVTLARQ